MCACLYHLHSYFLHYFRLERTADRNLACFETLEYSGSVEFGLMPSTVTYIINKTTDGNEKSDIASVVINIF